MMRERDLLVKEVFPELRRKCAKRFVTFTEVDLRWGITEAQANEGQVLPLCLAEIERSRPYFIGLLGERYGWIPDTIRPEVIELEPWLQEHVQGRTSVTELEILHGVLNNPQMQSHAFFYFRDPAYANNPALTDDERRDMVERDIKADVEKYGPAEAIRRTEERKAKLAALKQRIRDSKLPLVEPYANPEALAEIVRRQFDELIDRLYPEDQTPDLLAQERMAHEAHAKNKLFACIDRPAHLAALNAFAVVGRVPPHGGLGGGAETPGEVTGPAKASQGLVVTGESGGGKTALLAAWARDWAQNHPEDFLFQHYFGATPDGASPEGFLRRLLGELKARFGITDDIPTDPEKLRDVLPLWLAQTIGKGRIIFVLDGLNQVQGNEPDRHLLFLPRHFPPHATVLVSALDGPALDELLKRGWAKHDLPLADQAEVDDMVGEYLKIHARTLELELRHQLVTAPGAKNPLFLRTVLEELRQFGSFERLPQRVRHYLEANNPKDLFLRVLTRWQEDFDGKDSEQDKPKLDLVRRALTHLWAARQGLSESEWLDLLGWNPQPAETHSAIRNPQSAISPFPLPRALWAPFFLALEPHLSQRAGLFAFGHDFLRQSVETRFLPTTDSRRDAHLAVADYFEFHLQQRGIRPRKVTEWPYQLQAAGAWDRLQACLTDIPLFSALYQHESPWELIAYWNSLQARHPNLGQLYSEAYARWSATPFKDRDHYVPMQLGQFLRDSGYYSAAEPFLRRGLEALEQTLGPDHRDTLVAINSLGELLEDQGDEASAEALYRRAWEGRERVFGPENPYTLQSLSNLGRLLLNQGDLAQAEPLIRRAKELSERFLGEDYPLTLACLQNLAELEGAYSHYVIAEALCRRALAGRERLLGRDHPSSIWTLLALARLLQSQGDHTRAEPLLRRAVETAERAQGVEHPDTILSLASLASLLQAKGDYTGAELLHRRAVETSSRVLGAEHRHTLAGTNRLAHVLLIQKDHATAEPLFRKALAAAERTLGPEHRETLNSVNGLAAVLFQKGEYGEAEPLFRRVLKWRERALGPDHPDLVESIHNLAQAVSMTREASESEALFRRAVALSERHLGAEHEETLRCVMSLADFLVDISEFSRAQPLYERAVESLQKTSAAAGFADPRLRSALTGCVTCLRERGHSETEIRNRLESMTHSYHASSGSDNATAANTEPSPRVRQVFEKALQDRSIQDPRYP